ncbi:uncharacterized protein ASCRUDRAFT_73631 [Ascoidea rubescens DSM 1968]|uniref:Uncharacterized protein n=1 Tax=Ascoidea rubescens DSM 1968 TaxID=1344418 RepID=A0A1D2VQI9_9ASCO|nr:hypothetical protein ASCRUDRAFT_73631 [Ascoidea rubescens DSM 1968]ODV63872.1 hypothetical protein ASCRUDRAFT_73631 [Ascoidea rubescens DSM 1968]
MTVYIINTKSDYSSDYVQFHQIIFNFIRLSSLYTISCHIIDSIDDKTICEYNW